MRHGVMAETGHCYDRLPCKYLKQYFVSPSYIYDTQGYPIPPKRTFDSAASNVIVLIKIALFTEYPTQETSSLQSG